jgi:hypothetical protein
LIIKGLLQLLIGRPREPCEGCRIDAIVRDLFLGPRRYSELQKGLGGIPTDILAARLRTLQKEGIV